MKFISFTLMVVLHTTLSCSYQKQKKEFPVRGSQHEGPISFANVLGSIFTPHCIECHATYNEYEVVKASLAEIERRVYAGTMPKNSPPLSQELQGMLRTWSQQGAPVFAGDSSPAPTQPLLPHYNSIRTKILAIKCLSCHGSNEPKAGLDLSTYESVMNSGVIDLEDPDSSLLYSVVEEQEMPPPDKGTPLSATELETILEWITRGAPESQ